MKYTIPYSATIDRRFKKIDREESEISRKIRCRIFRAGCTICPGGVGGGGGPRPATGLGGIPEAMPEDPCP